MAKYTASELQDMVKSGHAIKNANGDPSYPVKDAEDLDNAIRAVGRGGADHDAIRRHIIARAKALGLSSKIPDSWGADGSLKGATARRDPAWEARRKRWAGSLLHRPERRKMPMEMRSKPDGTGGTNFEFEGYGAVFNAPFEMWDKWGDPYTEVVRPGAFSESLSRPDLYVPFLIGHNDQGIPLAQTANGTMKLSQDTRGLHVMAQLDGRRSDVRNLAYAVERGDMSQMSIGFVTTDQEWSPDWEQRSMLGMDVHQGDVSPVAVAANAATGGSNVAFPAEILSRQAAAERRGAFQVDTTDGPDYDPQNNGMPMVACPYVTSNGCGQMNPGGNRFCGNCGGSLYSEDGTIVVGDSGVPDELEGDTSMALAAARAGLERRQRELALLTLAV
jgi:HK97 family phage prohead protease